jgi:hypothetical protein
MAPDAKSMVVIVVLSLGIWVVFYSNGMPLNAAATSVVVLALAILVLAFKAIVQSFRRGRADR